MDKQDNPLEQSLCDDLWAGIDVFKKTKPKYSPTRFMQMLKEHGAVETAKRLLHDNKETAEFNGLTKLCEMEYLHNVPNALNNSMEAIIYNNEKYWPLFTKEEREICKKRLTELDYFKRRSQ